MLGPATGIVEPTRDLELFLELGIFVLFFIVGLDEIDVPGFVATMRGRYSAAAIISVVCRLIGAALSLLVHQRETLVVGRVVAGHR